MTKDIFNSYGNSLAKSIKEGNHCCARVFSPLIGVTFGIIELTEMITFVVECALKILGCLVVSIFCCENKLLNGTKFMVYGVLAFPFGLCSTIWIIIEKTFQAMFNPGNLKF